RRRCARPIAAEARGRCMRRLGFVAAAPCTVAVLIACAGYESVALTVGAGRGQVRRLARDPATRGCPGGAAPSDYRGAKAASPGHPHVAAHMRSGK
ncbi:MAG: hypothetical protein ACREQL_00615, partial [Candidatus Binatia bacterium]